MVPGGAQDVASQTQAGDGVKVDQLSFQCLRRVWKEGFTVFRACLLKIVLSKEGVGYLA